MAVVIGNETSGVDGWPDQEFSPSPSRLGRRSGPRLDKGTPPHERRLHPGIAPPPVRSREGRRKSFSTFARLVLRPMTSRPTGIEITLAPARIGAIPEVDPAYDGRAAKNSPSRAADRHRSTSDPPADAAGSDAIRHGVRGGATAFHGMLVRRPGASGDDTGSVAFRETCIGNRFPSDAVKLHRARRPPAGGIRVGAANPTR